MRKILAEEYSDGPGGLGGNDDAGQMSAWYVFGALGFYPVDPVSGVYMLCAPLFDSVVIRLPEVGTGSLRQAQGNKHLSGRGRAVLKIVCHKKSKGAMYISKVKWNGKLYDKNYIVHDMLKDGGRLEIWLEDAPSGWGAGLESRAGGL